MNQKPDSKRELQDCLDELRDQILADLPEADQQVFLARLRERIREAETASPVRLSPWKKPAYVAAAVVMLGVITALLQPWNPQDINVNEEPPLALLEDLDLIRSLSQLDSEVLASLTAVDLGAATLVYEKEQDIPFDLLLAASGEDE